MLGNGSRAKSRTSAPDAVEESPLMDDSLSATPAPKDYSLSPRERRVVGVLIEKAKTVPDSYPMTLNGIVTGCNQKSNRHPQMTFTDEQVEDVIESLRHKGLVVEIQGSGRVPKFKHQAYDWFGANKVELAVLAELLLRGEQTLGDLRSRTSRMEPIADLGEMQRIVQALIDRGLMQALTPAGRGQMVSHAMYLAGEQAELAKTIASSSWSETPSGSSGSREVAASRGGGGDTSAASRAWAEEAAELRLLIEQLSERLQSMEEKLNSVLGN